MYAPANHELNAQIKTDAEELGILTSVCDAPLFYAILFRRLFTKKAILLFLLGQMPEMFINPLIFVIRLKN
jgi:siroheme synthase (precorrin-2 oxidase/ferrochelatase)